MVTQMSSSRLNWFGAILVSAAFVAFVIFLLIRADAATSDQWARYLTLFSSVEALGFAAAGMLLGRTIDEPTRESVKALRAANDALSATERATRAAAAATRSDLEEIARSLQTEGSPLWATKPRQQTQAGPHVRLWTA